jgi:hypothetical protein
MYTCTVRSPWTGSGTRSNPYRPQFAVDYPSCPWSMISGNAGDPTCDLAAEIPDQATADHLAANTVYATWNWVLVGL